MGLGEAYKQCFSGLFQFCDMEAMTSLKCFAMLYVTRPNWNYLPLVTVFYNSTFVAVLIKSIPLAIDFVYLVGFLKFGS